MLWHIRLPEVLQSDLGISRSRYEVTLDRLLASSRPGTHMLDLDSFLMQHFVEKAKSYNFMGITAVIDAEFKNTAAFLTSLLRWQNDQGQRRRQEYTIFKVSEDGQVTTNPEEFSEWLKKPATTGVTKMDRNQNKIWFIAIEQAADHRLADISNQRLHPENNQWVSGAWVE